MLDQESLTEIWLHCDGNKILHIYIDMLFYMFNKCKKGRLMIGSNHKKKSMKQLNIEMQQEKKFIIQ